MVRRTCVALTLAAPPLFQVSCNASTQARDIRALCAPAASTGGAASVDVGSVDGVDSADASSPSSSGPFRLVSVQAVDLYPQTWHVETVAVLDAMGA